MKIWLNFWYVIYSSFATIRIDKPIIAAIIWVKTVARPPLDTIHLIGPKPKINKEFRIKFT
jgi:hypothetical protein